MAALRVSLPFSHVVHIGAGVGGDADAYLAAGLKPIVLVEADPEAAMHLHRLQTDSPSIQVVQAAVSGRPGPQTYYHTNFTELNGLYPPGQALKALFPGLEILASEPVSTLAPGELVAAASLPRDGAGLLVIEAPGEAVGILEALAQAGHLEGFRAVRVQEGHKSLYEAAPGMTEVQKCLRELGYECWLEPVSEDPDRPHLFSIRMMEMQVAKQNLPGGFPRA